MAVGGVDMHGAGAPASSLDRSIRQRAHAAAGRRAGPASTRARAGSINRRRSSAYSLESRPVDRNVDEVRVTVVGLAVGESELGGFDYIVKVLGRIVPERTQVKSFEQAQLLEKNRALGTTAGI